MALGSTVSKFAYPIVRPHIPGPAEWLPFLKESYRQHWFSNFGPVATRLEAGLAETFGAAGEAFVATASATAGLAACLIAEGITGPVLLPAFTFPATATAIRMAGAEAVLVDVDAASGVCDLFALEQALDRTEAKAAILVAPFGIAQDFSFHVALCESRGAITIIDNAAGLGGRQASHGAAYEVYSLHATKPFAVGEGGAIRTNKSRVAGLRAAINFGLPWDGGASGRWGINGKMPDVSAAIGLAVLREYDAIVHARREQAAAYVELFDRFGDIAFHRVLDDAPWQVFPCLMPNAAATAQFVEDAAERGLEVRRYYRPSLDEWGGIKSASNCPVSRILAERMACLPIYTRGNATEIAEIHRIIESCLARSSKLAA